MPMMDCVGPKLTGLERLVFDKLLAGDHPVLAALRRQLARCAVVGRHFSGAGFFTDLRVSPRAERVPPSCSSIRFGDVLAELRGVEGGAGFLMFVDDGYLTCLEGYVFVGAWPEEPEVVSLRYHNEPRDLSGLKPS